jgi:hypothetical protein
LDALDSFTAQFRIYAQQIQLYNRESENFDAQHPLQQLADADSLTEKIDEIKSQLKLEQSSKWNRLLNLKNASDILSLKAELADMLKRYQARARDISLYMMYLYVHSEKRNELGGIAFANNFLPASKITSFNL